jgi:hypothetical protein
MEFAPFWHEKELVRRKRHWMVWFSNACEKENDCSWLANHNENTYKVMFLAFHS